jgi:hypothetical protein
VKFSYSYNGRILLNSEDSFVLRRYLKTNSAFHALDSKSHHSWPCSMWDNRMIGMDFEMVFAHGLISRNFILV